MRDLLVLSVLLLQTIHTHSYVGIGVNVRYSMTTGLLRTSGSIYHNNDLISNRFRHTSIPRRRLYSSLSTLLAAEAEENEENGEGAALKS